MTAAEIAALSGIPEQVIVEKFGLRGKHIAAADEHVSDLSVKAVERLLDETGFDPKKIDVVMYYGSMWRDHAVWQAAPHIAYRVGATNAFAVEYDNVSHGTPIALRVARDMLRAEPELENVLVVAACRESYLLDYANEKSRFMFNFGDGAVAGLLVGGLERNQVLGSHAITNGAYSLQVKVAGGGSVDPDGYPFLDVQDPAEMKGGLDQESLPNFVAAARGAAERSGLTLADLDFVCPLHTKRSMFEALLSELGMTEDQAVYLDDTGHMSGVDSLLGLDRAVRDGRVGDGDAVLLLSAGTGYTWAATVVRWGDRRERRGRLMPLGTLLARHARYRPEHTAARLRGRAADVRAARRARDSCRECADRARAREGRQGRDDARELRRGDRALPRRRADGARRRAALAAPARHRADESRQRLGRPDPDHERGDGAGDRPPACRSARHRRRPLRARRRRGSGLPRVPRARRRGRYASGRPP